MTGAESGVIDQNEGVASRNIDDDDGVVAEHASTSGASRDESTRDRPGVREGIEILASDVTRGYLNAMSLDWFTVQELAEMYDTPSSTAYRNVNALEEAGLLKGRVRVSTNGKHPKEYRCRPISLTVVLGKATGLEMQLQTVPDKHSNNSG